MITHGYVDCIIDIGKENGIGGTIPGKLHSVSISAPEKDHNLYLLSPAIYKIVVQT